MNIEATLPTVPDVVANEAAAPVESFDQQPEEVVFNDINEALSASLTQEEIAQFGDGEPEVASPAPASQQSPAPVAPSAAPAISPEVQALMEQNALLVQQMQQLVQQQAAQTSTFQQAFAPKAPEPPKRPSEFKNLEEYEAYLVDRLEREKIGPLQKQLQDAVQAVQGMQRQAQVSAVDQEATGVVRGILQNKFPQLDPQRAAKVERTVKEVAVNMAMTYGARSIAEVAPLLNELLDDLADGRINSIKTQAQASVRPAAAQQQPARLPKTVQQTAPAGGIDLPMYSKAELTQAGYSNYMEASHDGFRRLPRK